MTILRDGGNDNDYRRRPGRQVNRDRFWDDDVDVRSKVDDDWSRTARASDKIKNTVNSRENIGSRQTFSAATFEGGVHVRSSAIKRSHAFERYRKCCARLDGAVAASRPGGWVASKTLDRNGLLRFHHYHTRLVVSNERGRTVRCNRSGFGNVFRYVFWYFRK